MRFFIFSIFLILLIVLLTLITANTITGNVPITPNCGAQHTYAFYRTLEETKAAENEWLQAGFVPTAIEKAPDSFHASGRNYFMCIKRLNNQELKQVGMYERRRVVTEVDHV